MASATIRAGYGTGAGRARGWMRRTPARNLSVNRHKISRGNTPVEMVKEVLGHEKVDTTLKCYASISKETVRQAHARFVG